MLNVWPIFVMGVETGLVLAILAFVLVEFCLPHFFRARQEENLGND